MRWDVIVRNVTKKETKLDVKKEKKVEDYEKDDNITRKNSSKKE